MSDGFKFGDLIKPGDAGRLAMQRELELRRDSWDRRGYHYRGAGDFLLQHGRYYAPPPAEFRDAPSETCFVNALMTAEAEGLRYCEGLYAVSGGFLAHAWCLNADDGVVECTIHEDMSRCITDERLPFLPPDRWSYWGAVFPTALIRWHSETYLTEEGEPGFGLFDRSKYELWKSEVRYAGTPMEGGFSDFHDFPILKRPFDPTRTTLPDA